MMNKWMGALLAATALIPATAMAQDGSRREARQQQRAERQQMRAQPQAREAGNIDMRAQRQGGGDRQAIRAQRQAQRQNAGQANLADPAQREVFVRQRQAVQAQRQVDRADRRLNGQPMRPQLEAQGNNGQRRGFRQDRQAFQIERRDDRNDFRNERRDDRNALQGGVVTQRQFRADRRDDRQDFRRDRADDARDFQRDRADDRRDLRRDGRQDQRRFDNRPNQRQFYGDNNWRGNDWNRNDRNYRGGNGGGWNRGWRNDNRYDWRGYRQTNRNAFRLPRYYAPQGYGYGYQRFGIGVTLGSILFAQDYWINDPWSYRLPPIDGPYRWVRYYNDAMLVDLETGEVVDVEYDIFW